MPSITQKELSELVKRMNFHNFAFYASAGMFVERYGDRTFSIEEAQDWLSSLWSQDLR